MKYKVVSECNNNEVWASGFYGEAGKDKAQSRINIGYFSRFMRNNDKRKALIVVEDRETDK